MRGGESAAARSRVRAASADPEVEHAHLPPTYDPTVSAFPDLRCSAV
ncbi:hypothetical protein [Synechococcus sp. MIT S9509]